MQQRCKEHVTLVHWFASNQNRAMRFSIVFSANSVNAERDSRLFVVTANLLLRSDAALGCIINQSARSHCG
jgi:hypothetical protein